jgi:hypothetical protein
MKADYSNPNDKMQNDQPILRDLLNEVRAQTAILSEIKVGVEVDTCLLDKIAHIVCMTANEAHRNSQLLASILDSVDSLLELYRAVHPDQALQIEKLDKLRAEMQKCCPPAGKPELICEFEPCKPNGGIGRGDGYSMKSKGFVEAVHFDERPPEPWKIKPRVLNVEEDDKLPIVPQGAFFGRIVPSAPTPQVLDFRSGGGATPGSEEPVTFRTFTTTKLSANWPPDMSGAKGGDVVLMSGNLWLKFSVDSGKTFTDLDFTKLFAADSTYGGWAGDQVIHYIPAVDCFVLYVQAFKATSGPNINKNVVKIALASQADLKKFSGDRRAWSRQWDFTPDTFGLGASWLDFPDMSYGDKFLYVNTNVFAAQTGKLFFELPLADMQAGRGFNFQYAFLNEKISIGSPSQNILGDQNYWAAHVDNSTMRIYSSKGTDANFSWRERKIKNWPMTSDNNIVSAAPDSPDWISEDHRIIGATRKNNELWFAWSAATGDGGGGGFKFPQPHIQIAKFDLEQDFKLIEQTQVWNADNVYAYPSLITNSNNEVGISLAWGGGKFYGNHAAGILGDFVVWYGEISDVTVLREQFDASGKPVLDGAGNPIAAPTRFGDYLHVRLAQPDTRFFSAFGYAVKSDATVTAPNRGRFDYFYIEFGREALAPSPLR